MNKTEWSDFEREDLKVQDVNPAFQQLLGYSRQEALNLSAYDIVAHEREAMELSYVTALEQGSARLNERKWRSKDGRIITVDAAISTAHQGGRVYFLVLAQDVSKRKQAEDALRESESVFHSVITESADGIVLSDEDGRIVEFNQAIQKISGLTRQASVGKFLWDFQFQTTPNNMQSVEHRAQVQKSTLDALETGQAPFLNKILEIPFTRPDGSVAIVQQRVFVISTEKGWRLGSISRDITERKLAETALQHANIQLQVQMNELSKLDDQLREQNIHDPLTQLYNRLYLDEALAQQVTLALHSGHPLGILMIDIDHFKNINDTYGHEAGDETLQTIANFLISRLRTSDIVCRYGGEEIICIMPHSAPRVTLRRAGQLRRGLASLQIITAHPEAHITASIGVAILPEHGKDANTLLKAADLAMYAAKNAGRNCVQLFDSKLL